MKSSVPVVKGICLAGVVVCASAASTSFAYTTPTSVWPATGCVAQNDAQQLNLAYMPAGIVKNVGADKSTAATLIVCMLARTDNTLKHPSILFDFAPSTGAGGQAQLVATSVRGNITTQQFTFLNNAASGGGFQRVGLQYPVSCLVSDATLELVVALNPADQAGPMQFNEST